MFPLYHYICVCKFVRRFVAPPVQRHSCTLQGAARGWGGAFPMSPPRSWATRGRAARPNLHARHVNRGMSLLNPATDGSTQRSWALAQEAEDSERWGERSTWRSSTHVYFNLSVHTYTYIYIYIYACVNTYIYIENVYIYQVYTNLYEQTYNI